MCFFIHLWMEQALNFSSAIPAGLSPHMCKSLCRRTRALKSIRNGRFLVSSAFLFQVGCGGSLDRCSVERREKGPQLWFPPGPSGGASLPRGALGFSSSLHFTTVSTVFTVQVQRAMWASPD